MSTATTHPVSDEPDPLPEALSRMLWNLAQHRTGARPIGRKANLGTADALVARRLIRYTATAGRDATLPVVCVTDLGKQEIARRWPTTPLSLGTHERPPGGWSPFDSSPRATPHHIAMTAMNAAHPDHRPRGVTSDSRRRRRRGKSRA